MKKEFTEEIRNKVLDLLKRDCFLSNDYNYNVTIFSENGTNSINVVMSDGVRVWAIRQYDDNGQTIATFTKNGDESLVAVVPYEAMEIANSLRFLNGNGDLQFAWDYIEE